MGKKCTSCRSARNANNSQTLACLFSLKSKQRAKQTLIFPLPFVVLWSLFWHLSSFSYALPWFLPSSRQLAAPQTPLPLHGYMQGRLLLPSDHVVPQSAFTVLLQVHSLSLQSKCLLKFPGAKVCFSVQKQVDTPAPSYLQLFPWEDIGGISSPLGLTWVCSAKDLLNAREGGCCTSKCCVVMAWS